MWPGATLQLAFAVSRAAAGRALRCAARRSTCGTATRRRLLRRRAEVPSRLSAHRRTGGARFVTIYSGAYQGHAVHIHYGEFAGYAINTDATDFVLPNPERQAECIALALGVVGLCRRTSTLSAHTPAPAKGRAGCQALRKVFASSDKTYFNNAKSLSAMRWARPGPSSLLATCRHLTTMLLSSHDQRRSARSRMRPNDTDRRRAAAAEASRIHPEQSGPRACSAVRRLRHGSATGAQGGRGAPYRARHRRGEGSSAG